MKKIFTKYLGDFTYGTTVTDPVTPAYLSVDDWYVEESLDIIAIEMAACITAVTAAIGKSSGFYEISQSGARHKDGMVAEVNASWRGAVAGVSDIEFHGAKTIAFPEGNGIHLVEGDHVMSHISFLNYLTAGTTTYCFGAIIYYVKGSKK